MDQANIPPGKGRHVCIAFLSQNAGGYVGSIPAAALKDQGFHFACLGKVIFEDVWQGQMLRTFDSADLPFSRCADIDEANAAGFHAIHQLLGEICGYCSTGRQLISHTRDSR